MPGRRCGAARRWRGTACTPLPHRPAAPFPWARVVAEAHPPAVCVQVEPVRRDAVAEPTVDRRLRRVECGERLAVLARVREQLLHEPAEDPAPAVRRHHADPRDAGRGHGSTRHGQLELVGRGEADRRPSSYAATARSGRDRPGARARSRPPRRPRRTRRVPRPSRRAARPPPVSESRPPRRLRDLLERRVVQHQPSLSLRRRRSGR